MADFMQVVTAIDSEDAAERLARGITGAPRRLRSDRRPYQVALLRRGH